MSITSFEKPLLVLVKPFFYITRDSGVITLVPAMEYIYKIFFHNVLKVPSFDKLRMTGKKLRMTL